MIRIVAARFRHVEEYRKVGRFVIVRLHIPRRNPGRGLLIIVLDQVG
jgi:hypothetical protein